MFGVSRRGVGFVAGGGGGVSRRGVLRQFLAADDGEIQPDLDGNLDAAYVDLDLAVEIPAERAGREELNRNRDLFVVDFDRDRLGFRAEIGAADRANGFLGHDKPLKCREDAPGRRQG